MEDTTAAQVFRCSPHLKNNLKYSAELMNMDMSSYIRWAIATCNRMVSTQFETKQHS